MSRSHAMQRGRHSSADSEMGRMICFCFSMASMACPLIPAAQTATHDTLGFCGLFQTPPLCRACACHRRCFARRLPFPGCNNGFCPLCVAMARTGSPREQAPAPAGAYCVRMYVFRPGVCVFGCALRSTLFRDRTCLVLYVVPPLGPKRTPQPPVGRRAPASGPPCAP